MGKTLKNTNQEENRKAPEKHIWKGGLKVFLIMALSVAQEHLAGYIWLNCYIKLYHEKVRLDRYLRYE